jgi:protein-ribulosamine 3-kinase
MSNEWDSSWPEVFARHRLEPILNADRHCNGADAEIDDLGNECIGRVIPRLLGALEQNGRKIDPVLLHGDLYFS